MKKNSVWLRSSIVKIYKNNNFCSIKNVVLLFLLVIHIWTIHKSKTAQKKCGTKLGSIEENGYTTLMSYAQTLIYWVEVANFMLVLLADFLDKPAAHQDTI